MAYPADRVLESSTTTGTGTFSLGGAQTGYRTFVAGIGSGNVCCYGIWNQNTNEYEVGYGTVTSGSPDTLTRTTVFTSSNSNALVNFSAGTKDVFVTQPSARTLAPDPLTARTTHPGQYLSARYALTDGATIAVDWNNGNIQTVTLGGNRTFTFANPADGARYVLVVKQDATGSRTVTWPTIKWVGGTSPTLTTTANKKDVISIIYDGTDYLGAANLNF